MYIYSFHNELLMHYNDNLIDILLEYFFHYLHILYIHRIYLQQVNEYQAHNHDKLNLEKKNEFNNKN